ncbi:MAG: copper-translocating P-type ATPase [Rhodothermaeota bacterium MED-G12]|jgi:Cu2+-exporting ATPase|nr:MAG: copper-translocating P-type ATPase [Rhodothermaeota bacterium MED-G12]CAI8352494.1 MAG: putative copper-transporting ATPase PacS [Rhodothermaeota bacterium MED-G12]|tara:strand:- start:675 stop:2978 length:2304 start_codon:yes stop_codon:yes gene_type:complete
MVNEAFPVTGMSCAACASSVESILSHTKGVQQAEVNFATELVWVEYEESLSPEDLHEALKKVGYGLLWSDDESGDELAEAQKKAHEEYYYQVKTRTIASILLSIPVIIIGMGFMDWTPGRWISLVLSLPVLFYFGRHFYVNAWKQARHGQSNMDTLVALSTGIAFLFSLFNTLFPQVLLSRGYEVHVYYEAAVVIIAFVSLGKWLEERAKSNTSTALKKLMGLQPKNVHIWMAKDSADRSSLSDNFDVQQGEEQVMPLKWVKEGQIIIVRPGEHVPVDGQVIFGESYVDESMITGEPIGVLKKKGERVYAGTINQKGSFYFIAEKVGKQTYLSQIISRVQQAQGSKAPVQKLVDRIAGVFVPFVLGIAVLSMVVWMVVGGQEMITQAILAAVAVLVIACPCALGLATPTAIMVGIGKGAEHQILIKDAQSLELAHKVDTVVLDKTGTLTQGRPALTDEKWFLDGLEKEQSSVAAIIWAIEHQSEHPLSEAFLAHYQSDYNSSEDKIVLTRFESMTGKGVEAEDQEGNSYTLGSISYLRDRYKNQWNAEVLSSQEDQFRQWEGQAKTVIGFIMNEELRALFALADPLKPTAKGGIDALGRQGLRVIMLSGDSSKTAEAVAKELGIEEVWAQMLPEQKADKIRALQAQGCIVAMVGDGINDSEALAAADVSVAMGQGSDIAMDVAKVTLISSDPGLLAKAFTLSHDTVRGIRQNLFWAFIYNIIGIPIAAGVLYPFNGFLLDPMIAGAAMAFSSVSVVTNSLRLKTKPL